MLNLKIILASTRPGRKGPSVAAWVNEVAQKHGAFNVELLDLAEINLPFMDEPNHPRMRQYQHQHTRDWSAKIDEADAFIFVLCEYNHCFPATIKNALDYLFLEWNKKPVGFVTYGGIAAGIRSQQMLKPVLAALDMVPVLNAVNIPFFDKNIDANGTFVPTDILKQGLDVTLNDVKSWAEMLKPMREKR